MEFKIECPWCNQHYSVDDSLIGQNVECSICKKQFTVRKPTVSIPKIEKTTEYSSNQAHNPEKKTLFSKTNIRKVIIGCAVLVVVSVSICVICYVSYIPEKEYKNGLKAYNEQRYEEAVEFFQKAAEYGHEEAKTKYKKTLAEISCNKGKKAFVEHRYTEAVEHLQIAADLGYSEAQVLLGLCYFNGEGIIKNSDEAVIWFRKAAEQNNPQAQFRLGLCYLAGIGVNPREEEGVYWLQKAAEQRNLEAQIALGDFYYNKGKTLENFSEALKWYQIAEETGMVSDETKAKKTMCGVFQNAYSGDTTAQLAVVVAYEGELFGLKKDETEAKKWLIMAADSGNAKAQGLLGAALMRSGDEEEGLKWLHKAGEQEDIDAMVLLAKHYAEKSRIETLRNGFSGYSLSAMEWTDKAYAALASQGKKDKEEKSADKADQNINDKENPLNGKVDMNRNKIPDEWEKEHNISMVSANSDEDSDGFTLIQEYEAKTNPTNPLSHPKYITQVYVDAVSQQRFTGLELVSVDRTKPDKKDWQITFNVTRNNRKRTEFVQIGIGTFKNNNVDFSVVDIEIDDKTQDPIVYIQRVGKTERIPCRPKQAVYDPAPRVRFLNALVERTFITSVGAEFKLGTEKTGEELYKIISADLNTKDVVVESISETPEIFTIHPSEKK